jgi:hypothetical protein
MGREEKAATNNCESAPASYDTYLASKRCRREPYSAARLRKTHEQSSEERPCAMLPGERKR